MDLSNNRKDGLDRLHHVTLPLKNGGNVLVLDTGALIEAEAQAMLAARYSRSLKGVTELLRDLFDRDTGKFMREHYQVGYGHKSIGELGEAAVFIDGVSMLAAEAIEHFPLYRGQESSTRYINFRHQPFQNPLPRTSKSYATGNTILERWRTFYLDTTEAVRQNNEYRFPFKTEYDAAAYQKAIKARTFDAMRSFLPCGATTNVALVCDLRHLNDHLFTLRNHPLPEVRDIGLVVEAALATKFPDSFGFKRYEESERYYRDVVAKTTYFHKNPYPDFSLENDSVDRSVLLEYIEPLTLRPQKSELPFDLRECGNLRFAFTLDFGSFRDLQRQRAVTTRMPLVTSELGFEEWYLAELPEADRVQAIRFIDEQLAAISALEITSEEKQYFLPMGMKCAVRTTGDLRALTYLTELRASRFVHPTFRRRAFQIAGTLLQLFSAYGMMLHLDTDADRFDVKRGTHDIVKKNNEV